MAKMNKNIPKEPRTKELFDQRVEVREPHQCWPWRGCVSATAKGLVQSEGILWLSHRLAAHYGGADILDHVVSHTCGNTLCCNPNHLAVESSYDMYQRMKAAGRTNRGETNRASKLTAEEVREIRASYVPYDRENNTRTLGERYGVTPGCIRDILIYKTWVDA